MAAVFKLQFFIIIVLCFHSRSSSYGYKLPHDGVKIVTHGMPCYPARYLPVTIEEPVKPVTEPVAPTPGAYQSLKLNYRVITDNKPISYQSQAKYPISIQVPQVPVPQSLEINTPDPLRGKTYTYNIQTLPTLPTPSVPISMRYDFGYQVPPSPVSAETPTPKSVKLLTGLTSKIDRVLIPACQVPSSSCNTA